MLPTYQAVFLDSGPAGLITNPKSSAENDACKKWFETLTEAGVVFVLPEIVDYELRRELIRLQKTNGLTRLDILKAAAIYLPITTNAMLKAAEFWAHIRQQGKPTADSTALDGDVILAAQVFASPYASNAVIATSNPSHLSRFSGAFLWQEINEQSLRLL